MPIEPNITFPELQTLRGINTQTTIQDQLDSTATSSLSSGRIYVGNGSGIATGVAMTGDVSINNAGVTSIAASIVTGKLITGFVSGAGVVAATDTILEALEKLDGNITAVEGTANAALPAADFSDANVTGKLITGFVSGAGVVAATDTILEAINKLDGNSIAIDDDANITGKLITGYVSGAGTVQDTDSILEAIEKLNGNADAISTVANAALPSASFTDAAVTGKLITGYVSGAGVVAATDTILEAIQKLNGNLAGATGSFTAQSGETITVANGLITAITP